MRTTKKQNTYAVVDLEATGTGMDAKIIQIGIVCLREGQVIERYETDINPHEPLTEHIKQLTGITDAQLARAPEFHQVAGKIFSLLEQAIFVAHNVQFDANFLAEALFMEGYELRTPRVDTVELAQIFFPTVEKYTLSYLADKLHIPLEQAHTAIADAEATAQLLVCIQERIRCLPKQTISQIVARGDDLLYESQMAIEEVWDSLSEQLPADVGLVHQLVLRQPPIDEEEKELDSSFKKNRALLGLEPREKQEVFAQKIEEGLADESSVHFIQAQAGIGKTYGYLLPLLAKTKQRIVVSVPTHILQEQVMEQEGERLWKKYQIAFQTLKSPRHYLDLDAFWDSLQEESVHRSWNVCKLRLLVWLCETETGDLDEIQQPLYPAYLDTVRHRGFVGERTLFGEWDFWQRVQVRAKKSRVIVTNHAYFLHHVREENSLFEGAILVFDEAQKLLLTAEEYASQSMDIEKTRRQMRSQLDRSDKVLERRLLEGCLFELQELEQLLGRRSRRELTSEQLEPLAQHLSELGDREWQFLIDFFTDLETFWLEETFINSTRIVLLRGSRLDLLHLSDLLPKATIFCISATLEISPEVKLADLLGFSSASLETFPMDYASNQCIYLPSDLPPVTEWKTDKYARFIASRLMEWQEMKRPIVVLFTSIRLLLRVSEVLDQGGGVHLAQYRDGQGRVLQRRFEKGEAGILLGTGLFWEGVDFSMQDELIQVITRLPFDNPSNRLTEKIHAHLLFKGKDPFRDYSLPMMLLKLQQAIGRVNRSAKQRSAVILLDQRVVTKSYGSQIRAFLSQTYPLQEVFLKEVGTMVENFFEGSPYSDKND